MSQETITNIAIATIGGVVGVGVSRMLTFFFFLVRAPAVIYKEQEEKIDELNNRIADLRNHRLLDLMDEIQPPFCQQRPSAKTPDTTLEKER